MIKQAIVVRRDIHMGTGKLAAQVAHAAVLGAEKVRAMRREWFESWIMHGQAKIVLKVKDKDELLQIKHKAESLNLPVVQVDDAGLTQLEPGTTTCIAIGPAPADMVDKVTGELKLL
ncbi:MAG: peptidyl-tRNA hydrolase Pth2 [Candidatus Nitrosocaldus sp.]